MSKVNVRMGDYIYGNNYISLYYTDKMKCYYTFSYQLPFRHIMSFTEEQIKLLLDPWSSFLSHRDLEALVVLRTFSSLTYSIL